MSARPRLLYLVTEDWYFCSHRLPMARAAWLGRASSLVRVWAATTPVLAASVQATANPTKRLNEMEGIGMVQILPVWISTCDSLALEAP